MQLPDEKQLREYDRWKVERPTHEEHGLADTWENPISSRLTGANARNWRMEGPGHLVADTDFGPLHQNVGLDYICLGTDAQGLPILKKLLS